MIDARRMKSPFEIVKPQKQKLSWLPFGEVRPCGWIREQMKLDLKGFVGHLDQLVPDLILQDDIYGRDRLTKKIKKKSVGNIREGDDMIIQYLWWNAETQMNWLDGFTRHSILLDDKKALQKAEDYVRKILSTQDEDGYLGIYDRELRYRTGDENGELWSKATLLRMLIAWYEYKKETEVFTAIECAVENVIRHFPVRQSTPFKSTYEKSGGLTHGLAFTDALDWLHQFTGKKKYSEYAVFLYENFSEEILFEDAALKNIKNKKYKLHGHGVHTYEHLRSLAVAFYSSGNSELKKALHTFISRIEKEITPTGGPIGDEWIYEREADATSTGYEYCSLQELLDSYSCLLQKSGKSKWGDKIELLYYNAAQGARHPYESSIAYCKSDNSFAMTGTLNDSPQTAKIQTRFKYSPTHKDVAVCCVPNAGRITPYFVKAMWMKSTNGLTAALLGPSEVNTEINGTRIQIQEDTQYPFDTKIKFTVSVSGPIKFALRIRKPGWAKKFKLNIAFSEEKNYFTIEKIWNGTSAFSLEFLPEAEIKKDLKSDFYFTHGALVFALPIQSKSFVTKTYPLKNFRDVICKPVSSPDVCVDLKNISLRQLKNQNGKTIFERNRLKVKLFNKKIGREENLNLVPVGATLLRRVTFPKKK